MKTLWAIVVLLIVGAVAVLAMGRRAGDGTGAHPAAPLAATTADVPAAGGPRAKAVASTPANPEPATTTPAAALATALAVPVQTAAPIAASESPLAQPAAPAAVPGPASTPERAFTTTPKPELPGAATSPAPAVAAQPAPSQAGATAKAPQPEAAQPPAGGVTADELAASLANPGASTPPPPPPPPTAAPPSSDANDNGVEANPRFPADKLVLAKVEKKADGVLVLDGRFAVRGSGTKEDPYRFPWDLLVSAQETYKPRMGQMKLPQRVAMFDGKYIRVSGFVAFPITSSNPREMLSMLNQWDGCCIGVPPTAYDAIEVKLANPANAMQRLAAHGTVEGRLKVDPYLDGGWLLGLYLMEDAKLTIDD